MEDNIITQSAPTAPVIQEPKPIRKRRTHSPLKKRDVKRKTAKRQRGFSLLELVVVVAIMLIIAGVAVPSFLRARTAAQESSAANTAKSISTALNMYQSKFNVWPQTDLSPLGGDCSATPPSATSSCVMDDKIVALLVAGTYSGYTWTYTPAGTGWTLTAAPIAGSSATRNFFVSDTGAIHYNDGAAAVVTSPVLGN